MAGDAIVAKLSRHSRRLAIGVGDPQLTRIAVLDDWQPRGMYLRAIAPCAQAVSRSASRPAPCSRAARSASSGSAESVRGWPAWVVRWACESWRGARTSRPTRRPPWGAKLVDKSPLFAEADAITLHLFLSERTRNIVGAREFEQMKPGAILVNTARAGLVDETALLQRLQQGALTAALDVYWQEPPAADERALRRRRRAYDGFQLPLHSRIPHTRRSRRCASCLIDRAPVARRRCLLHAAARKAMRLSEKPGFAVARM